MGIMGTKKATVAESPNVSTIYIFNIT